MKTTKVITTGVLTSALIQGTAFAGDLSGGVTQLAQYGKTVGLAVGGLSMVAAGILYAANKHMHGNQAVEGALKCALCIGAGGGMFSMIVRFFS